MRFESRKTWLCSCLPPPPPPSPSSSPMLVSSSSSSYSKTLTKSEEDESKVRFAAGSMKNGGLSWGAGVVVIKGEGKNALESVEEREGELEEV